MKMNKNQVLVIAIYLIVFLIVWNLCDLVYDLLIRRTGFTFEMFGNIGQPLLIAIFVRLVMTIIPKQKR